MPFTHRVHDDPSRCAIGEVHVAPTVRCSLLQEVTPMSEVVSPARIAAELTELWSPRVVAELDDSFVKVAKVHGSLAWRLRFRGRFRFHPPHCCALPTR